MNNIPVIINGTKYEFRVRQRTSTTAELLLHGKPVAMGITFLKPGEKDDPELGAEYAISRLTTSMQDAGIIGFGEIKALYSRMLKDKLLAAFMGWREGIRKTREKVARHAARFRTGRVGTSTPNIQTSLTPSCRENERRGSIKETQDLINRFYAQYPSVFSFLKKTQKEKSPTRPQVFPFDNLSKETLETLYPYYNQGDGSKRS